jgi:hypothetical protein
MAERTPVVKKYRDALETVISATMDFISRVPAPIPATFNIHQSISRAHQHRGPQPYTRTPSDPAETSSAGMAGETAASSPGRWEGRQGELGQMDAEWLLSFCEGEKFNLQMLDEMMKFEPSLGA